MKSFSIHLVAEVKKIDKNDILKKYDELEMIMLEKFFDFVSNNSQVNWVHWNMSNIIFGFETLIHRHEVLSGKIAPSIPDSKKHNLSLIVQSKYGKNCVDSPKMKNLMFLNDEIPRGFLEGKDEVIAFKEQRYGDLHKSTTAKVYWFKDIYNKLKNGKVIVKNSNWKYKVNTFFDWPVTKFVTFIGTIVGAIIGIIQYSMC
ncbi:hypothetical protein HOH45_03040 [bacterium]|nr:hypothetical protein [bacterium]